MKVISVIFLNQIKASWILYPFMIAYWYEKQKGEKERGKTQNRKVKTFIIIFPVTSSALLPCDALIDT